MGADDRTLEALKATMGPELLSYMTDDNVFELMLNSDGKLWIDTFDKGCIDSGMTIEASQAKRIIYAVSALSNQVIDTEKRPFLEADIKANYLFSNCRFQGELPTIVDAPSFNIRKHSKQIFSLDDYVRQGTMSSAQKEALITAIKSHKNIIAAGGTASGKTTMLNAILNEISKSDDRVIIIEDTPELQCSAKNHQNLKTRQPLVDMDALLRITLRKSPKRIVVGEVRGKEALTLLTAWSTGHRGGCSTIHSDSALDTLYRLEEMISEASLTPQQARIGRAIDVVVYLRMVGLKRVVEDIIEVVGYNKTTGEYITKSLGKYSPAA